MGKKKDDRPSWMRSELLEKQGWSEHSEEPAWKRSELLEKQGWSEHRERHEDCPPGRCVRHDRDEG